MSLKDRFLDLPAHNWLHIAAAVCIGILLYQNHQQKLLIEQQAADGRELSARVIRDTGAAVGLFLHETLLHPHVLKEGETKDRSATGEPPRPGYHPSTILTYSYALPEDVGQELLRREAQLRNRLADDIFHMQEVQPEWCFSLREGIHPDFLHLPHGMISVSISESFPLESKRNYQQEPWREEELLPPGYKWYTAEIEYSFPEFPVAD